LIKDRYPDKQIILHMNNDFLFEHPELKDKYIQVLSKVDRVIGCSAFVSNSIQLNSGILKEKVKVIHNGVSLQWFKKLPHNDPKMLEWRNKLGFKENEKVIVFIGRLLALKGPHILIKAFDKIAQDFPDARLLIVGSSWYAQEDQTEFIKELSRLSEPFKDKIKFSGYVSHDQLNYLYNLSVITVVPSIVNEAFGLVILESMAAGSAVIGSSVGGIPEIIKDKETGLLVRSDDVKDLEEKIRFLLDHEDERQRLIENALEYVQGSDWSVVASKIESVYLDLKKNRIS
jgi:spore coat protein SA